MTQHGVLTVIMFKAEDRLRDELVPVITCIMAGERWKQ